MSLMTYSIFERGRVLSKKLLSTLIVALMVFISLTGMCGCKESEPEPFVTMPSEQTSQETEPESSKPLSLDEAEASYDTFCKYQKLGQYEKMWSMLHPDAQKLYGSVDEFTAYWENEGVSLKDWEVFPAELIPEWTHESTETMIGTDKTYSNVAEIPVTLVLSSTLGDLSIPGEVYAVAYENEWRYLFKKSRSSSDETPAVTPPPAPAPPPTPAEAPAETPPPAPPVAPETVTCNGRGDDITEKFVLEEGITVFTLTHDGSSNFIVELLDKSGSMQELLVNEIGSFDGSVAIGVDERAFLSAEPGAHILEISADGDWTAVIEQPRPATAEALPVNITGHGCGVSQFFFLDEGLATFKMSHDGDSNFIVHLYSSEGSLEELLANEIGSYSGKQAVSVKSSGFIEPEPGIYILSVIADGDWTIEVK
jgi:predicted small lipoprotein YifL